MLGEAQPHLYFWVLSFFTIAAAIGVVTVRNLIHAALLLALTFVTVAGIFVLLNAPFLAAVQVLVYAGGIITLMIFAIMLSEGITRKRIIAHNRQSITALVVAVAMAYVNIAILMYDEHGYYIGPFRWWVSRDRNPFPDIENALLVGRSLMTTYTLAFWIASVILAIAMIGSLIFARAEKDMPGTDEPGIVMAVPPKDPATYVSPEEEGGIGDESEESEDET